jgi:hypothetical protein
MRNEPTTTDDLLLKVSHVPDMCNATSLIKKIIIDLVPYKFHPG